MITIEKDGFIIEMTEPPSNDSNFIQLCGAQTKGHHVKAAAALFALLERNLQRFELDGVNFIQFDDSTGKYVTHDSLKLISRLLYHHERVTGMLLKKLTYSILPQPSTEKIKRPIRR